jgi:3'-phosphoadenosine 5'-phosphosulfate (PAPS) 3'-phosphatase
MAALSNELKNEFKTFIAHLCEEAAKEILPHYGPDVAIERKSDATPVTIADRNA